MNDARLNALADEMLTPEFVQRLYLAKMKMKDALQRRRPYRDTNLARDLDLPPPVARIVMSLIGALVAEGRMDEIITLHSGHPNSELRH